MVGNTNVPTVVESGNKATAASKLGKAKPVDVHKNNHGNTNLANTRLKSKIMENIFLLLLGSSQRIAHTSSVIYQFLVEYHILVLIKGSNWVPIHQVCQRRILEYYIASLKDFYYHAKLLDQTQVPMSHT